MNRTHNMLLVDLINQMVFLKTSCDTFDQQNQNEALRMAVSLRVLFHDTSSSSSILKQLGIKDKILIEDSSLPIAPQKQADGSFILHGLPGLIGIGATPKGGKFIAPLALRNGSKGYLNFQSWWDSPCIPAPRCKPYSRKELVLDLVNKEGGAHINKKIKKAYQDLTKSSTGTFKINDQEVGYINNVAYVSMRQIAWEVLGMEVPGNIKDDLTLLRASK